jgi:hypothetical protein
MKCGLHAYGRIVGMTPNEIEKMFEVTLEPDSWEGVMPTFENKDSKLKEHDYIQVTGGFDNVARVVKYMAMS